VQGLGCRELQRQGWWKVQGPGCLGCWEALGRLLEAPASKFCTLVSSVRPKLTANKLTIVSLLIDSVSSSSWPVAI
jgi:hypothetical protein